jgi:peptidoglycan/xylan/chitin deacetylase (PgdA/CDA1 family)
MNKLTILCYHGIVDDVLNGFNSSGKHLHLAHFKKQMEYVAKNYQIITMMDVENFYQGKTSLPKKSVAITFDDGYANNYKIAHPILKNLGLKATLYLATGYIGRNKLMWTDKLELAILNMTCKNFWLHLNTKRFFDVSTLNNKIISLNLIKKYLKKLPTENVFLILNEIFKYAGNYEKLITEDLHKFLSWNEVKFMHDSGIWEIGAHTVDHFSLGVLTPANGIEQITRSISDIKKALNTKEPVLFSYPEGLKFDMPKYSVDYLNEIGLKSAPSALAGTNYISKLYSGNRMCLKRILVGFESLNFPWKI